MQVMNLECSIYSFHSVWKTWFIIRAAIDYFIFSWVFTVNKLPSVFLSTMKWLEVIIWAKWINQVLHNTHFQWDIAMNSYTGNYFGVFWWTHTPITTAVMNSKSTPTIQTQTLSIHKKFEVLPQKSVRHHIIAMLSIPISMPFQPLP